MHEQQICLSQRKAIFPLVDNELFWCLDRFRVLQREWFVLNSRSKFRFCVFEPISICPEVQQIWKRLRRQLWVTWFARKLRNNIFSESSFCKMLSIAMEGFPNIFIIPLSVPIANTFWTASNAQAVMPLTNPRWKTLKFNSCQIDKSKRCVINFSNVPCDILIRSRRMLRHCHLGIKVP